MTRFTTGGKNGEDEKKHVGDDYFLGSNDKIRFFFEEGTLILPFRFPPPFATNTASHRRLQFRRHPNKAQISSNKQNRPRPPFSVRPLLRHDSLPTQQSCSRGPGFPRPPRAAEHGNLQAARNRRGCAPPPGLCLPVY